MNSKPNSKSGLSNNMWHIHTKEYYSALKKNNIEIHPTTWMNLKNIMRNEIGKSYEEAQMILLT